MKTKRGAIEEGLLGIFKIFLVLIVAFFILGIGAFTYAYYLDIRDVEATLMARETMKCIAPEGVVLDLQKLINNKNSFLENYCNFSGAKRFYVKAIINEEGKEVVVLEEGNNNLAWTKGMFESEEITKNIRKFKPGILTPVSFPVLINGKEGEIIIGVIVSPEF